MSQKTDGGSCEHTDCNSMLTALRKDHIEAFNTYTAASEEDKKEKLEALEGQTFIALRKFAVEHLSIVDPETHSRLAKERIWTLNAHRPSSAEHSPILKEEELAWLLSGAKAVKDAAAATLRSAYGWPEARIEHMRGVRVAAGRTAKYANRPIERWEVAVQISADRDGAPAETWEITQRLV
jgi:hypothetical protein